MQSVEVLHKVDVRIGCSGLLLLAHLLHHVM
jgi:hypothetical protein